MNIDSILVHYKKYGTIFSLTGGFEMCKTDYSL